MAASTCMGDCLAFMFGGDGAGIQKYLNGEMQGDFTWLDRLRDFCTRKGVEYSYWTWQDKDNVVHPFPLEQVPEGQYIAIGVSPRAGRHAIVVGDGQMIYDPDESAAGLVEIDYLIAFDPVGLIV